MQLYKLSGTFFRLAEILLNCKTEIFANAPELLNQNMKQKLFFLAFLPQRLFSVPFSFNHL